MQLQFWNWTEKDIQVLKYLQPVTHQPTQYEACCEVNCCSLLLAAGLSSEERVHDAVSPFPIGSPLIKTGDDRLLIFYFHFRWLWPPVFASPLTKNLPRAWLAKLQSRFLLWVWCAWCVFYIVLGVISCVIFKDKRIYWCLSNFFCLKVGSGIFHIEFAYFLKCTKCLD